KVAFISHRRVLHSRRLARCGPIGTHDLRCRKIDRRAALQPFSSPPIADTSYGLRDARLCLDGIRVCNGTRMLREAVARGADLVLARPDESAQAYLGLCVHDAFRDADCARDTDRRILRARPQADSLGA